jgi:hypothetical protein
MQHQEHQQERLFMLGAAARGLPTGDLIGAAAPLESDVLIAVYDVPPGPGHAAAARDLSEVNVQEDPPTELMWLCESEERIASRIDESLARDRCGADQTGTDTKASRTSSATP